MATTAEDAVRNYLTALHNPTALRDESTLEDLRKRLEDSSDMVERLRLRQELMAAESPPLERYEEAFVEHAKEWAEKQGITASAFREEGVPTDVLRRAGFRLAGVTGRRRGGTGGARQRRSRVTSDEVRAAIPKGTFTIAQLQERSGASPAVVRNVVKDEVAAGRVDEIGTDPDHRGPGRAPTLYKRGK